MRRYTVLDILRGIAIISMVVYHTLWDIVNIFGVELGWYESTAAGLWQMSIRWGFILISGFSWSLGSRHLRRALTVIICSVIISVGTKLFMPRGFISFGVLALLGFAMLVTIPLDRIFKKLHPLIGLFGCFLLFLLFKNAEIGEFGIGAFSVDIPAGLYANELAAFLGFPNYSFYSADYVPIIPWIFVFWMGYFLYRFFEKKELLKYLRTFSIPPLEFLGRHSLLIYMLHQPICYGVLYVIFSVL